MPATNLRLHAASLALAVACLYSLPARAANPVLQSVPDRTPGSLMSSEPSSREPEMSLVAAHQAVAPSVSSVPSIPVERAGGAQVIADSPDSGTATATEDGTTSAVSHVPVVSDLSGVSGVRSVPASVLVNNVPPPISTTQAVSHIRAQKAMSPDESVLAFNTQSTVQVKRGVNEMIAVAISHVNRIVTPFEHPDVVTADLPTSDGNGGCGAICVKQNVVYVAPKETYPVTLFITEKGSQARSISVTLVPRSIPPKEIFLTFGDKAPVAGFPEYSDAGAAPGEEKKAQEWEESQPFIETITDTFRQIALGNVPRGYTIKAMPHGIQLPSCEQAGLDFRFGNGQYITGHHLVIFVGTARNMTDHPVEFQEPVCGEWNIAAVSAWPRSVLSPQESTEVYVALQPNRRRTVQVRRPSLLHRPTVEGVTP